MTEKPMFDLEASVSVAASPEDVYRIASDVTRMGEWSPENTGGEWVSGEPGRLGSRFHGHNRMGDDTFTTECEVIAAEPGRRFAWTVLTGTSDTRTSVWSFEVDSNQDGTRLIQRYQMRTPPARLQSFLDGTPDKADKILAKRKSMLQDAMRRTVEGIKTVAERA